LVPLTVAYPSMAKRHTISVIGDGAMGTVCSIMLAENGHNVRLWSAFAEAAADIAQRRENMIFLPGHRLPEAIEITADDELALAGAELVVSAVPTQYMRTVWIRLRPYCAEDLPICSVAKGIENGTLLRPTQILNDVLGRLENAKVAALSGPSIAPEIARKLPATVVVAGGSQQLAEWIQTLFTRPYFRVYTNPDLVGVEVAGAAKNVVAIAAGIVDGLGLGDNAKAALITRGLAELTRLGSALGAMRETFFGLAGLGDLVTTCISPQGRNRSFGQAIGQGQSMDQALRATRSVVEGVPTTVSLVELARHMDVELPIIQAVHRVLFEGVLPSEAVLELMSRPLKAEG